VNPRGESALAVVIPACDAAHFLERSLPAVLAAAGDADVLVVDAGSLDRTAEVAAGSGARVLSLSGRAGPSAARNAGVEKTRAEVVLFLDADCVPRPDVVERVQAAFAADPGLVALTGSYTRDSPEPGFFSQYMNLRHHHTHQIARREGATFWSGCGAVRRSAFAEVGGFDAEGFPNGMEDMELGLRLRELGPTRLDPELQVTHLKRWSLRGVVEADVLRRAVPWARMILERGALRNDLNVRFSQRAAAALAPFSLAAVAGVPLSAAAGAWGWAGAGCAALAASAALNAGLLGTFARARGPAFAAGAFLFHQVHLVYAAATLAFMGALHALRRERA
jgi:GT2 family glycosyltransferase